MEDEAVLWEAPVRETCVLGSGASATSDEDQSSKKELADANDMHGSSSVGTHVKDIHDINGVQVPLDDDRLATKPMLDSKEENLKQHDKQSDASKPGKPADTTEKLEDEAKTNQGIAVALVLEENIKLGAKIKSFQDPAEVRGEVERVEDARQPLCILITEVSPGGAAERFGLSTRDRLLLVDSVPVESFDDYKDVLGLLRDKRPLTLTFLAFGQNAVLQRSSSRQGRNSSLDALLSGDGSNGSSTATNKLDLSRSGSISSGFEVVNAPTKKQLVVEKYELALMSNNPAALQRLASRGLTERYRPIFWRLLLNYLPGEVGRWQATLDRQRALYEEYKKEFLKLGLSSGQEGGRFQPSIAA